MNLENAQRLIASIPDDAKVLDVGGGASPFPRADYVIDALPFAAAGRGSDGDSHRLLETSVRYKAERWAQLDLCAHRPWPFADKYFDFAVCSHVLEDVRDPLWICTELQRVAKAGYIEVPSRVEEQSRGVEHPGYAGYHHHRWLISRTDRGLQFRHKPNLLHALDDAIVENLHPGRRYNPQHAILTFEWNHSFAAEEVLGFDEQATVRELCDFAASARRIPDLTIDVSMPLMARIKRHVYYRRLARGRR